MNENESAKADNKDLLHRLKSEIYYNNDELLAEAVGRPVEEIQGWFTGAQQIDEDAEMKIHNLAQERLKD